jgi:alpha-beta hydrolase superfamily lysophospholipase
MAEVEMGLLFQDDMHAEFGQSALAYIPYGGPDFGEIQAIGRAVGEGDDLAFYQAWINAGARSTARADATLKDGHRASARELYMKASAFYAASYRPLFGEPVDARLLAAYRAQMSAFENALALGDPPVHPVRIPFGETTLPGYLIPAVGRDGTVGPLLILTNGYDATMTDMYLASAVAASRRGYHCLLFDGPGQGEMLFEHAVRLRPDWETVITAVVDFAIVQPMVDPSRIALSGWSLGGYLAPRGASGEHRLAALVADPGLWSMAGGFRAMAQRLGVSSEAVADLGAIEEGLLASLEQIIANDPRLNWSVIRRGYWVHGVDNLRDYLRSAEAFTMDGRCEMIACPTLVAAAEDDPLSQSASTLFDALRCSKDTVRFAATDGAGTHCEMMNRSLLNRTVFDWLDERLGATA